MPSPVVVTDTARITDWPTFHAVFAEVFGFPGFYGANMNAWIDCMTSLDDIDDIDAGMTTIHCERERVVTLQLSDVADFAARCPEQFKAVVECTAFVNWRRLEMKQSCSPKARAPPCWRRTCTPGAST